MPVQILSTKYAPVWARWDSVSLSSLPFDRQVGPVAARSPSLSGSATASGTGDARSHGDGAIIAVLCWPGSRFDFASGLHHHTLQ